jgi:hypothetical protein
MPARTSLAPHSSLRAPRLGWLPLVAAAALAPLMAGCELPLAMMIADDASNDDVYDDDGYYYGGGDYYGGNQSALETKNAALRGDLGDALGIDAPANFVDAWHSDYSTSITLWADGAGNSGPWAAMSGITIEGDGGIANEVFKPGAKLHFDSDNWETSPYVYTIGCSGTGEDAELLDYEASGTETDIEVTEVEGEPGMVHLSITVRYENWDSGEDQVVHNEIDVAVPQ